MKKFLSCVLALTIICTMAGFAGEILEFESKKGMYSPKTKTKQSSTGSAGSVTVDANENEHSMYYQIHKANGGAASEYKNTKGTGTYTLTYKNDGNGESLGRNGYEYRLRVAHRSQCTCTGGSATVEVDFIP